MVDTDDLTDLQRTALSHIKANGPIYQSQLWKELDMGSRSATRIARALTDKDLIDREKTQHNGNTTYKLTATPNTSTDTGQDTGTQTLSDVEVPTYEGELSPAKERALRLIYDRGEITQSELWKTLGIASRTGTRAARALADKDLIDREETQENGRKTYILTATEDIDAGAGGSEGNTTPTKASAEDSDHSSETDTSPQSGPQLPPTIQSEELSEIEEIALKHILKTDSIPMNDLLRELKGEQDTVIDALNSLGEKGLIKRRKESFYGRETYLIEPNVPQGTASPASP